MAHVLVGAHSSPTCGGVTPFTERSHSTRKYRPQTQLCPAPKPASPVAPHYQEEAGWHRAAPDTGWALWTPLPAPAPLFLLWAPTSCPWPPLPTPGPHFLLLAPTSCSQSGALNVGGEERSWRGSAQGAQPALAQAPHLPSWSPRQMVGCTPAEASAAGQPLSLSLPSPSSGSGMYSMQSTGAASGKDLTVRGEGRFREKISTWPPAPSCPPPTYGRDQRGRQVSVSWADADAAPAPTDPPPASACHGA